MNDVWSHILLVFYIVVTVFDLQVIGVSRVCIANQGLNCIKSFLKIFYEVLEMNGPYQSTNGAKSKFISKAIKEYQKSTYHYSWSFMDENHIKSKLKVI